MRDQFQGIGPRVVSQGTEVMTFVLVSKIREESKIQRSQWLSFFREFLAVLGNIFNLEVLKLVNGPPLSPELDGIQPYSVLKDPGKVTIVTNEVSQLCNSEQICNIFRVLAMNIG